MQSRLIIAFGPNLDLARKHYIIHRRSEGRLTSGFNPINYLNNYDHLSNAFGKDSESAIRHFINNGYSEGRTDKNFFNIQKKSELIDDYNSI